LVLEPGKYDPPQLPGAGGDAELAPVAAT
jgi:hypothetical protein